MLKLIFIDERTTTPAGGRKPARSEEKGLGKVIYIAGPITGHEDYIERFCEAQLHLERQGFVVLNPADLPAGMPADRYMPICLAMLEQADAVYMLRGWEDSNGAGIEYLLAEYQGKEILYEK